MEITTIGKHYTLGMIMKAITIISVHITIQLMWTLIIVIIIPPSVNGPLKIRAQKGIIHMCILKQKLVTGLSLAKYYIYVTEHYYFDTTVKYPSTTVLKNIVFFLITKM